MGKARGGNHNAPIPAPIAKPASPIPSHGTGTPPERNPDPGARPAAGTAADWRSSYRKVLAIREFQALWLGHALSMTGGNLLSIAVTVLVYQRTSSALAAGFTFALTFLPQVIGGPLLAGLADLFPRRRVMILSDLARALLIAALGLPGLPLWGLWVLLFLAILPIVPFGAARAALLTEIVPGDRYVAGSAIINMTSQVGALLGLALGGAIITWIGPNSTLALNGATFLLSAIIIVLCVRARPGPLHRDSQRPTLWKVTRHGTRLVFADPRLRTLALLAWLAGFYAIPLGVANPLAADLGGGAATVSVIMASVPAGALIGGFVLTRLINPEARVRLLGALALMASLPLVVVLCEPPLWALALLLTLSGICGSYQFVANAAFVLCAPDSGRGLAFGLVASGLQAAQGLGMVLGSLLVETIGSQMTIGLAGVCGVTCAAALIPAWRRLSVAVIARMRESEPTR